MGPQVPLGWKALWPTGVTLALALGVAGVEWQSLELLSREVEQAEKTRAELDRAFLNVQDRHRRSVRRAREAVREAQPDNRLAILSWSAGHYMEEMDRFLLDAQTRLDSELPTKADANLKTTYQRLKAQLDRLREGARRVGPALDGLLGAVASEDPESLDQALRELEQADQSFESALTVTQTMGHRAAKWRLQRASRAPVKARTAAWGTLALWFPLGLWLSLRPILRIRALARGGRVQRKPLTDEEAALQKRAEDHTDRDAQSQSELSERDQARQRAAQAAMRAERELALLKLLNENLINSLSSAILVTDNAGAVTSYNAAARRLLSLEEPLPETLGEVPLFKALKARNPNIAEALARASDERQPLRYESVNLGQRLLDITIAPYLDESGAARGLIWVSDDVTDAVQTKNDLLAAEHMAAIGRVSAQVAHEIRNPLSAIGLNAELLEEDFAAELGGKHKEEAVGLLRSIGSEIERLTQITEGYLELARLPRPETRPADLNQLVSDLFAMLGEEMKTHGIEVQLELSTPPPSAQVDPGQLRQALLNVVRNSREAMDRGGVLNVSTHQENGTSWIEVTDSGPGISPEVVDRVFEPFFTTKPEGTGLGLSLTQQIVSEHGGTIEVSPADSGTRVTLSLPSRPV